MVLAAALIIIAIMQREPEAPYICYQMHTPAKPFTHKMFVCGLPYDLNTVGPFLDFHPASIYGWARRATSDVYPRHHAKQDARLGISLHRAATAMQDARPLKKSKQTMRS